MIVTLWGSRGSLACSGEEVAQYGGNTSCVEVYGSEGTDDTVLILDAGTGIRSLGNKLCKKIKKVHILLTHLHLDHIQGLGFCEPLYVPGMEVHIYGPARTESQLRNTLTRYLSPPLFPVLLCELSCQLYLHKIPTEEFQIGQLRVRAQAINHPGLTVGYRITSKTSSMAYLPDHEPALGAKEFPQAPDWTSGYELAKNVDLLLHDSQYSAEEYQQHVGWGHSAITDALKFAMAAKVKNFVTFHHDPSHSDAELDSILADAVASVRPDFKIYPGREGSVFELS